MGQQNMHISSPNACDSYLYPKLRESESSSTLSIAIVVRDDLRGMRRLLRSLDRSFSESKDPNYSVNIFLNGAGCDFEQKISSLGYLHPRLQLNICTYPELPMCEIRQRALETCLTHWVAFLDSDCKVHRSWASQLDRAIEVVASDDKVFAFGGGSIFRGFDPLTRSLVKLSSFFSAHHTASSVSHVRHLPTSNIVLRKSAVLGIGGFPSGFSSVGEDLALSTLIERNHGVVRFFPELWVWHAQRNTFFGLIRRLLRYGFAHGRLTFEYPGPRFSLALMPGILMMIGSLICGSLLASSSRFSGQEVLADSNRLLLFAWIFSPLPILFVVAYGLGTQIGWIRGLVIMTIRWMTRKF